MTTEVRRKVFWETWGYKRGDSVRDVTLAEARSWECNNCGGCCNTSLPDVVKHESGLPMQVWSVGKPTFEALLPVVRDGCGGCKVGEEFEEFEDGTLHTSYACNKHNTDDGVGRCTEYGDRPETCSSFPVFGRAPEQALAQQGWFVPPTSYVPLCTWYGIRIVTDESFAAALEEKERVCN